MSDIKISVVCITYNHKNLIRQALDGFIMQKTDFPFEVIVHDDASADGTADIVREYAEKYPQLIKAICQKENVYSKGVSPIREYALPLAKGEYIALCEGDDYWTDENKLQIQYNYMKSHPECALCAHQATLYDCEKNIERNHNADTEDRFFTVEDIIKGSGGVFATAAVLFKKIVYTDIPECLNAKGFGDFQLFLSAALHGTVYYMARNMATYNFGVSGSWTRRIMFQKEKNIEHCKEVIRMLNTFNEAYERKYDSAVRWTVNKFEYEILKTQGRFFKARKEPYREFYLADRKQNGFIKCFVRSIVFRFDFLYNIYKKIKAR